MNKKNTSAMGTVQKIQIGFFFEEVPLGGELIAERSEQECGGWRSQEKVVGLGPVR